MIIAMVSLVLVHAYNCFFRYKTWATTIGGQVIQCCGFMCWIAGILLTARGGSWVGCVLMYVAGWLLLHGPEIAAETKRQISGGKYKPTQTARSSEIATGNRAQRRSQRKKK